MGYVNNNLTWYFIPTASYTSSGLVEGELDENWLVLVGGDVEGDRDGDFLGWRWGFGWRVARRLRWTC
jgi:hypothetical protein